MNRSVLLPAAYLIDAAAGDPEWYPHPVRLMGSAISLGERRLRRFGRSPRFELVAGAALTCIVVGSSYGFAAYLIRFARRTSRVFGNAVELLLAWNCLAARNLSQEARAVTDALMRNDLALARSQLARIVGRDTQALEPHEIARAVIETVAESASDGIMAPLFYMALGGVPLAMAYKAVNTLDSIIGHTDDRYLFFGKAAARLDDVANYLPARLSALSIVAASSLAKHADAQSALQTWQRDGGKHKSPNAGQPESAMAGALRVALGGTNTYAGEIVVTPGMGEGFPPCTPEAAVRAIQLVSVASIIGLCFGVLLTGLSQSRSRTR